MAKRVLWSVWLVTILALNAYPASAECLTIKYRDTPVCLNTFACTETPQSSFVRAICYDPAKSYMLIKLNETWYHYCSVDRMSVDNLIHASSVAPITINISEAKVLCMALLIAGIIRCRNIRKAM